MATSAPSPTPPPASLPPARPPGPLREAHAHIASLGMSPGQRSLEHCPTLAACLEELARAAASAPPAGFVRMHSARPQGWPEARWPTRLEIDRASPHHPAVLLSFDHHSAAANSLAFAAAGLAPGVPVPPNGTVEAAADGSASGTLLEAAAHAAWNAAPSPTPAERSAHVSAALDLLASLGYTEVHDMLGQEWLGPLLGELDRAGRLPLAVRIYVPADRLARDYATRASWETSRVRLAGGKVFADGTLNSRTAHMLHRYDEPLLNMPRGQCMVAPRQLDELYRSADALGLPLAVHAIGDAAVRTVLDSIERVRPRAPGQRIEHCEIIDAADVPRFARLAVICSVQPCHLLTDIEALRRFLPFRLDRVLPIRELLAAGCTPGQLLLFGSDAPIVRPHPEDSLFAAVHRRRPSMPASDAIAPAQAIDEPAAWACFAPRPLPGA